MQKLNSASVGHGSVTYVAEQPSIPDSSETTGNVTVNVFGREGRSACWAVSYQISVDFENGGGPSLGLLGWEVRLPAEAPADARYHEVEAEAARQIAPMLRAVADSIEKQVAESEK